MSDPIQSRDFPGGIVGAVNASFPAAVGRLNHGCSIDGGVAVVQSSLLQNDAAFVRNQPTRIFCCGKPPWQRRFFVRRPNSSRGFLFLFSRRVFVRNDLRSSDTKELKARSLRERSLPCKRPRFRVEARCPWCVARRPLEALEENMQENSV